MSFELTLSIEEDSLEALNIDQIAEAEHVTREEAARKILASPRGRTAASQEALAFLGGGREDADILDAAMDLIMADRRRHNAAPPRD